MTISEAQETQAQERKIEFVLPVRYEKTLSELIADSKQDIVSGDIEKVTNFDYRGSGVVTKRAMLFVLPHNVTNTTIETYFPEGWTSAKIEDLLVLAELHSSLQKDTPIFATGSPVIKEGRRFYPCLDTISDGKNVHRRVRLRCDTVYTPGTRFLLIKA